MWLKRVYHQDKLNRDEHGTVTEAKPGAVKGVKVLRAKKFQNFSEGFVAGGAKEGWLTMGGGKIVIRDDGGKETVYRIVRVPGHYCCHCEEEIPDANRLYGPGDTAGYRHVRERHGDAESPDPNNPAGYRRENHYSCVLETEEVEALDAEGVAKMEQEVRHALHQKLMGKALQARGKAKPPQESQPQEPAPRPRQPKTRR